MARRTKLGALAAVSVVLSLAPGCAANLVRSLEHGHATPYEGTLIDLGLTCTIFLAPFTLVDLPFSFLADTCFVFEDVGKWIRDGSPAPDVHREAPKPAERTPAGPANAERTDVVAITGDAAR